MSSRFFLFWCWALLPFCGWAQPQPGPTDRPRFRQRIIFTGGTSLVLPLGSFKTNLSPAFSAASGANFMVNDRLFIGPTLSYNRHGYSSSALYPGIALNSNTELLNLFLNGRVLLRPAGGRLNPYLFAGPGVSIVSRPTITAQDGGGLTISKSSETRLMGNVGAGLDFAISPLLIMYLETAYNTSFSGSSVQFQPILVGFRTYPADLLGRR